MSNIMNDLHAVGLNPFAVTLVAESLLKSPLAPLTIGKPQGFFFPVQRRDSAAYSGVRFTLEAVPKDQAANAPATEPEQDDEVPLDYATEINRLRNVIQAACSGGLFHMIERWKQLFPDAPVPTLHMPLLTQAAQDVLAERQRQISAEGRTPEHDDAYTADELAKAAAAYAVCSVVTDRGHLALSLWPWDHEWFKPSGSRRNLVKAGALILAELERLDRAEHGTAQPAEQSHQGAKVNYWRHQAERPALLGWQPIETAPRDGTRVLCAWGNDVHEGWCAGAGTARDGGDVWCSHSLVPVIGRPTLWMPLPFAPSTCTEAM